MHAEDLFSTLYIGIINGNSSVKSTGTKKRGVKYVRTVGRRHNDNARVRAKAVHLNKKLI